MSIIVNGASIPTNGDYIVVNGVKVEKVTANGVTVWEKQISTPVVLTWGNQNPWDSRVQFNVIRTSFPVDYSHAAIVTTDWNDEDFGNDFVIDLSFPTLGNRTLEITAFQYKSIEIFVGNRSYTYSNGGDESNWTSTYDISGGSSVRLRCTSTNPWGRFGIVDFGPVKIF